MCAAKCRRLTKQLSEHDNDLDDNHGFASSKKIFFWPDEALNVLRRSSPIRISNLSNIAERGGFDMYSYYAGKGTDGTVAEYLNRSANTKRDKCRNANPKKLQPQLRNLRKQQVGEKGRVYYWRATRLSNAARFRH